MKPNDLPYQPLITDRILDQKRTNIWVPMGFGKTRATLKAIDILQLVENSPTLVLAPYRVANSTWPDESLRWDDTRHLTVTPILGTPEERIRALRADTPVFSINDENIPWLVERFKGRPWPFRTVIRDEQTRFAGFRLRQGTRRAKAIAPLAHTQIDRWVNLSGAPVPNGLAALWGPQWFIDQGKRLGHSFDAFHQRWFSTYPEKRPTKNGKWTFSVPVTVPRPGADAEIHARLLDCSMSLDSKDWFDLREPVVREIKVQLPPKARQLYRDMEKKMFMELDGIGVEAFSAAGKTIKCLQIASGFAFTDDEGGYREIHDAKLQALESVIEEAAGASVLVPYWFKPSLARLQRAFPKGRVLDKDPQTIRDWNAGKIPALWIHPMSGGHGLNMAEGGHIIAPYETWWDADTYGQVLERVGPVRQAQLGPDKEQVVMIYPILAEDTIDEVVQERHRSKRSTQDLLMAYMKRKR